MRASIRRGSRHMLSLDIGSTKVRACVADVVPGTKPIVRGVGFGAPSGVRRGVVVDVRQTVDAIEQAVGQACADADCDMGKVALALGGDSAAVFSGKGSTHVSSPRNIVTHEDVRRATRAAIGSVLPKDCAELHTLPRQFQVDHNATDTPVGMCGGFLEADVLVIAARVNEQRTINKCLGMAGLKTTSRTLDVLAAAQAVLTDDLRVAGTALVDFGGDTTTVLVYHRNRVSHVSTINVGGDSITGDIMERFGIPYEVAENLKQTSAQAVMEGIDPGATLVATRYEQRRPMQIKQRELCWVVEARVDEWVRLVRNVLSQSGMLGRLPGGITLVGGGSLLNGLADRMTALLNVECIVGCPQGVGGDLDLIRSPELATAVGIIKQAATPPRASRPVDGWFRHHWGRIVSWAGNTF